MNFINRDRYLERILVTPVLHPRLIVPPIGRDVPVLLTRFWVAAPMRRHRGLLSAKTVTATRADLILVDCAVAEPGDEEFHR